MAYTRKYFLQRVAEVQDMVLKHRQRGVTLVFIYNNYVKDTYMISYSTFNNWMGIPAKAELKRIEELETNKDK